jgi:hypothetical protein
VSGFSALLFLLGFLVQGDPPSPDQATAVIAEYLADNRDAILAGDLVLAFASAPFFWFLGSLRGYLSEAGEARLSAAGLLGAGVGTGIVLIAAAVQAALVLNSAGASEELVRFGFDVFNSLVTIAGGCLAVGAGATAVSAARTGAFPPWLWRSGVVTAVLQLVTLPGLAVEQGPWAAGGAVPLIAFVVLVGWYVAVTVEIVRHGGQPAVARVMPRP